MRQAVLVFRISWVLIGWVALRDTLPVCYRGLTAERIVE